MALLGNQAAQFGGGVILSDDNGASLTISGGLIAGNTAGAGGGAVALHAPAFMVDAAALADNAADRGGGVHLATDFGVSTSACAFQVGCSSPLHELNFTRCAVFFALPHTALLTHGWFAAMLRAPGRRFSGGVPTARLRP